MTLIQKMLKELCPKGVEFKTIAQIGEVVRGNGLQKKDFTETGVGCIHYGQIYTYYGFFTYKTKSFVSPELAKTLKKVEKGDLVIAVTSENMEDVCKCVAYLGEETIVTGGHAMILKHKENPKYLAYYFKTKEFFDQKTRFARGAKVIDISKSDMEKIVIPIPPHEIQNEIVRILDKFTELETELGEELEARRRQYQHYRDALLSFETGKQLGWTTLNKIAANLDSQRKPVTRSARTSGKVPYYGASGIVDYVSEYIFDGEYLLISEDGANLLARSTPIAFSISGKSWVNNHAHVLEFKTYAERRFVEIYLNSINLAPYISGAAQPKLNQENLNKIPIPDLSIGEQERIVLILDKFEALLNGVEYGLPAEIKARRQQYEYYRDQLLTFKEIT